MTYAAQVLEKMSALSPEKQQEVLDFVDFLASQEMANGPLEDLEGAFADLNVHITEEDIAEMRRGAWKNFPRDDVWSQ